MTVDHRGWTDKPSGLHEALVPDCAVEAGEGRGDDFRPGFQAREECHTFSGVWWRMAERTGFKSGIE